MFEEVCKYYKEHQQMPPEELLESMCWELYPKLHSAAPKASFEDLLAVFRKNRLTSQSKSKKWNLQTAQAQKDGGRKTCDKTCKEAGKEEKAKRTARAFERTPRLAR